MSTPEQAEVMALINLPENRLCADCKRHRPKWASCNLGIFICLECSGIHRSLGTHVSFVRSCNLDSWNTEQVMKMKYIGNEVSNDYWEARLPRDYLRPMDRSGMEQFIQNKYVRGMWTRPNVRAPAQRPLSSLKCRSAQEIARFANQPEEKQEDDFDMDDLLRQIDGPPAPQRPAQQYQFQQELVERPIPERKKPVTTSRLQTRRAPERSAFDDLVGMKNDDSLGDFLGITESTKNAARKTEEPKRNTLSDFMNATEETHHVSEKRSFGYMAPITRSEAKKAEEEPDFSFLMDDEPKPTPQTQTKTEPQRGLVEEIKSGVVGIFKSIFGRKSEKQEAPTATPVAPTTTMSKSPSERFNDFQQDFTSTDTSALTMFFSSEDKKAKPSHETSELANFFNNEPDPVIIPIPQTDAEEEEEDTERTIPPLQDTSELANFFNNEPDPVIIPIPQTDAEEEEEDTDRTIPPLQDAPDFSFMSFEPPPKPESKIPKQITKKKSEVDEFGFMALED